MCYIVYQISNICTYKNLVAKALDYNENDIFHFNNLTLGIMYDK
jgi:hypothetical protein